MGFVEAYWPRMSPAVARQVAARTGRRQQFATHGPRGVARAGKKMPSLSGSRETPMSLDDIATSNGPSVTP